MNLMLVLCSAFAAADAKPIVLPPGETRLSDIGLCRVGYVYADGRSGLMPPGWTGHFHGATGISYTPYGRQDDKACLLIHCPWRGGTGVTYAEYPLQLPRAEPIKLELAIAMKSDMTAPNRSDGSDFRVSVATPGGAKKMLLEEHYDSATWKPLSFDLTAYAGQQIMLRLETGPGPKGDASWDYSLFGDPRIIVGKRRAAQPVRPIWRGQTDLKRLANRGDVGCCPTGPVAAPARFTREDPTGVARYEIDWPADEGRISYAIRTRRDGERAASGLIDVRVMVVGPGQKTRGSYHVGLGSGVVLTDGKQTWEPDAPGVRVRLVGVRGPADPARSGEPLRVEVEYAVGTIRARVINEFRVLGSSLMIMVRSPATAISEVRFGSIAAPLRRGVSVPYLGLGPVWYLPDTQVFGSIVVDWTRSQATRHDQTSVHYGPMTNGKRNAVATTVYYTFAPRIGEVVCNLPHPPSPFLADLSGRIMFDVWGGRYRDDADWFAELASYGVRDAAIIKHVWQRSGYDNALPNHYPADERLGGDGDMVHYVKTTRDLGHRTSLHENYVDFYPNSELYDANDVSLDLAGKPVKAWFNAGTQIQSYGAKPTAIMKYARMQSPEIHRRYGTNASYLDVHTCVPPWFHVDHRAGEPGAATFAAVFNAHAELFAFERKTHEGPLFGEGNGHFFWAGLFDGAEAQVSGGENASWLLDFDLLKIHPQMVNHGMGYLERWLSSGYGAGWYSRPPATRSLDRYRAMELAFGHAGFVAQQAWRQLPYVLREYYLVTPIQKRYVCARPVKIAYETNGRMLPASQALAGGPVSNRVHVEYDSGLKLWCNGGEGDWTVPQGVLCGYGFRAEAAGLLVTTTTWPTLEGPKAVADYREADGVIYADARSFEPEMRVAMVDAEPCVQAFESAGPRKFKITYQWHPRTRMAAASVWQCFVHFTSPATPGAEHIVFQNDHALPKPVSTWEPGQVVTDGPHEVTVPAGVGDGDYRIMIGLHNETGRAELPFRSDARGRYLIGTVTIKGDRITCTPQTLKPLPTETLRGPYNGHTNPAGAVVDFGKLATNGCVIVQRKDAAWWITVFPRGKVFRVLLRMDRLEPKATPGPWRVVALDAKQHELGPVDAKVDGHRVEWQTTHANAAYYRISR